MQTYVDRGLDLIEKAGLGSRSSYKPYGTALLYERDALRAMNNGVLSKLFPL